MAEQPCKGRLCMDGIGEDCLSTCLSPSAMRLATAPLRPSEKLVVFPARYPGKCQGCKHLVRKGENMAILDGRIYHEECA